MEKKKGEWQIHKWTLKGLQYPVPDAKRWVLKIQWHCIKINNVFIQSGFNLYLIYVSITEAFLATHFLNLLTQKVCIRMSQKGSFQGCGSLKSSGRFIIIHLLYQDIRVYPSCVRKFCPAPGNDDSRDRDSKGVIRDAKNRSVGR